MTVRETRPLPIYSPYLPNRPLCSAACCWGARWGWTAEITRIFPLIILCSVEVAVFDGIFGIGWPTPAAGEAKASTIGGEAPDGGDPLADQKLEEEQKNLDRRRAQYHHRGGGDEEGEDEPIQGFPLHQIHQHQLQGPPGYAQLERMGDRPQFLLQQQGGRRRPPAAASRGGGEIVEVQGGHIVRSTGRKDRHSKVCTAKGPRDRRVRLSAHTAIQFYDVQDRLGYDRPSKAVDWLMKNAKSAIDKLAELPAWHPTATVNASTSNQPDNDLESPTGPAAEPAVSVAFGFGAGASSSFLPPSLDSDAIANTIKSFFPVAAAATAPTPSHSPQLGYQNYPQDLLSRGSSQDLRLSLHSFHDQAFQQSQHQHHNPAQQSLFSNSAPLEFDSGWGEQSQRMAPWEAGGGSSGGYMVNVPPAVLGHGQFFTQRGPLQSSSSPSARAWAEPMPPAADHQFQTSFSSTGFESGGIFSGFRIPARIQGEEEQDGVSDKPSSASSASHH